MKTASWYAWAGLAALILVGMRASKAEPLADAVQTRRDVRVAEAEEGGSERLIAVRFDADVYENTAADFANVRVEDERGQSVAFDLQEVRGTDSRTVRSTWQPKTTSARREEVDGEERLFVTLTLDEKAALPNGLKILTPLQNFEQTVVVETSADGESWVACGDAGLIFDYARFIDIRNDELSFSETKDRYFRLTITRPTLDEEARLLEITRRLQGDREASRDESTRIERVAFRIDSVEFFRETSEPVASAPLTQAYAAGDLTVREDPETQQTIVQFASQREPLTSLTPTTPSRNFSRRVVVQVLEDGSDDTWRRLVESRLSHVDFQGFQRKALEVAFPATRTRAYRLLIDNGDNPPLEITGVEPEGRMHAVVFLADSERQYQLVYGDDVERPVSQDSAVLKELLAKGFAPQEGRLGAPRREQPEALPRPWWEPFTNPWTLILVAAALVVILGRGLVAAAKRVDGLSQEP